VVVADQVDLILEENELLQLVLKVFKLRALAVEPLKTLINLLLPEPVVLLEGAKENLDVVLSALNGTGQEKDHLDDLLVLGNPVVEWLPLVLGDVLLVPVLDTLGGLKNVGSSTVDGALDLLKGWLKVADVTLKVHIDLEEGLEDLLRGISATANSLLHLIQRVLGCVEECLIHGPVVVLGQLLDFLS
jgi:hypothetical protein